MLTFIMAVHQKILHWNLFVFPVNIKNKIVAEYITTIVQWMKN